MKRFNLGLVIAVVVLLGIVGVMIFFLMGGGQLSDEKRQGSAPFNEEVVKSFKISSLTYRYTNIIYNESVAKIGSVNIPFTKKYLGVRYDGVMEIGIDASKLNITESGDSVIITLPAPEILSHTLVPGTTEVLFDVDSPLTQNKVADYTQLFESEQLNMEQRAIEAGMLSSASASAKEQLRAFIESIPGLPENYSIVFKDAN
ncbi:MAG: DUF4230 domain-containing protein [Propionibacteriaceae bacterium]|nr:DUF4230 domain-containing protein [Propionibacteriaceae bacterium]